jgi:hydrogenase-4 component E
MIDVLVLVFGVTLIFTSITNMLTSIIRILVVQGLILFVLTILNTNEFNIIQFIFVALETLVFKAILIPYYLNVTIKKNRILREVEPKVSNFFSLFAMVVIFGIGFFIALWSGKNTPNVHPLLFGIAFSAILKGFFVIIFNKKLITHLMGYLFLENGIFLLSLAASREMPYIVSLGVSLDILISILIAGLFISKIKSTFADENSASLSSLRD